MIRTFHRAGWLLALGLIAALCLPEAAEAATVEEGNVFSWFRNEMSLDRDAAAMKFMSPKSLAKWNRLVPPRFDAKLGQIRHFFALSMQVPKISGEEVLVLYFNPWVDSGLLTRWAHRDGSWKIEDFHFASGERMRGALKPDSALPNQDIPPAWLRNRGVLVTNLIIYYKYMRSLLVDQDFGSLKAWLNLSDAERNADLGLVKLRMGLRSFTVSRYKTNTGSARVLTEAFAKLVQDGLARNERELNRYSLHGNLIAGLEPGILKTLKTNWIFTKNNIYTVMMNSAAAPRLFIYMNISSDGTIEDAYYGDLELMAAPPAPVAAARAQPSVPAPSPPNLKQFTDPQGNQVEIITETRNGKTTMTTRVNGKVTEVVSF